MKCTLVILSVMLAANFSRAQQSTRSGSQGVTRSVSTSDFRSQVQQELAHYKHGVSLYARCDVFARIINRRASSVLGLSPKMGATLMSEDADTSFEVNISNSEEYNQDETTIAISRKDPRIIVAGANDDQMYDLSMPAYVSTNSGSTWETYRTPLFQENEVEAYGDPIITADDSGNFYYAFLIVGYDDSGYSQISDLMVAHSSDGKNWTLGSSVLGLMGGDYSFEDKEFIAIDADPMSPYHGRLYIAWNQFNDTSGGVIHLLAYSSDQGMSWSTPRPYTQTYGFFPLVRTGENGTVFIASSTEDDTDDASDNSDGMTVSTDGGETFSENTITNYTLFPPNNGYPSLKGDNGFRAFPYVAYSVDPSNNAIDAVYATYDENNGDGALFTIQSSDEGKTWSENGTPVGTPSLLDFDHFMPWVSHDNVTGETYISMYSSEEDSLNVDSRSVRCDFQSPGQIQNLGSRLFDPLLVTSEGWNFIGDYNGNDAYGGCFAAAWTENRPQNFTNGNIFAYVASPLAGEGVTRQINGNEFEVSNPTPNPVSSGTVSFTISSSEQSIAFIHVFDLRGVEVFSMQTPIDPSLENIATLDIHALSAGVYHAQITSGNDLVERNFVVLR